MASKKQPSIKTGLQRVWNNILAILGILLIVTSVIISLVYIPNKLISIVISSIGSCIGMALVCGAYFRLSDINLKKKAHEVIETDILQKKLDVAEKSNAQVQLEKERLERMRIDITSFSPIMNLGLVSIDVNLHDFMLKVYRNEDKKEGFWVFKKDVNYYDEYVGAINKKFKAQLGIDLKKLRFKIENNKIIVSCLQSEFQGYMNEETRWLLREIRNKKIVDGQLESYSVNHNDHRIPYAMIEQENSFKERINLGIEFRNLDNVIQEMAKHFISLILSPVKKEIVFVSTLEDGSTIEEFIRDHNRSIETQIKQLEPL